MSNFIKLLKNLPNDLSNLIIDDYLCEEYGWEFNSKLVKDNMYGDYYLYVFDNNQIKSKLIIKTINFWNCLVYDNENNRFDYKKIHCFADDKKAYANYPNMPIYKNPYMVVKRYEKLEYNKPLLHTIDQLYATYRIIKSKNKLNKLLYNNNISQKSKNYIYSKKYNKYMNKRYNNNSRRR